MYGESDHELLRHENEIHATYPRRVLLTGMTGFIGSHLAMKLLEEQDVSWEVHAVVRESSSLEDLPDLLRNRVIFHVHPHAGSLVEIVKSAEPDIVIHLASLFLSQHRYEDIEDLLESNVIFGTKLLEAMKQAEVRNFINVGTAWQHYRDEDYNPVNLYAASKQAFEDILHYYRETADLKVITLKLFDTYGSGDKRRKLMALLGETAQSGECLKMSPGEQKIDMVHVDDVTAAFRLAMRYLLDGRYEFCGTYAVSTGHPIFLKELVRRYETIIERPIRIEWDGRPYREREVMQPWSKGRLLPGWERIHRELM